MDLPRPLGPSAITVYDVAHPPSGRGGGRSPRTCGRSPIAAARSLVASSGPRRRPADRRPKTPGRARGGAGKSGFRDSCLLDQPAFLGSPLKRPERFLYLVFKKAPNPRRVTWLGVLGASIPVRPGRAARRPSPAALAGVNCRTPAGAPTPGRPNRGGGRGPPRATRAFPLRPGRGRDFFLGHSPLACLPQLLVAALPVAWARRACSSPPNALGKRVHHQWAGPRPRAPGARSW